MEIFKVSRFINKFNIKIIKNVLIGPILGTYQINLKINLLEEQLHS